MTLTHSSPKWRKSSRSQNQSACVELHPAGAVRDSKNPEGPQLRASLAGLVSALKGDRLTR